MIFAIFREGLSQDLQLWAVLRIFAMLIEPFVSEGFAGPEFGDTLFAHLFMIVSFVICVPRNFADTFSFKVLQNKFLRDCCKDVRRDCKLFRRKYVEQEN